MSQPIEHDLTKGTIAGHFRTLAIPGALSMLFTTLYNIVDIFFAGMISTAPRRGWPLAIRRSLCHFPSGSGLAQRWARWSVGHWAVVTATRPGD